MRILSYVYDSSKVTPQVDRILNLIETREEEIDVLDVATANDPEAARREAMLTVKEAVRIGSVPGQLFDENGDPDFSRGALVSEESTGRRSLHVGGEALELLRDDN